MSRVGLGGRKPVEQYVVILGTMETSPCGICALRNVSRRGRGGGLEWDGSRQWPRF